MASTFSSSVPTQNCKYDVFLSFRGEDTRNNFVSHLHAALIRKSIRTFVDDELRRGQEIRSALLKEIEESKIAVVIFSKNYASSTYCLDELEKIMECHEYYGQIVIPIFFHVNPSDVSEPETGIFAEALSRHEKETNEKLDKVQGWKASLIKAAANLHLIHSQVRHEQDFTKKLDKVQRWKIALTKVANLAGHDLHIIGQEAVLVDKIVNDVWKRVKQISPSVSDSLVGKDSDIELIKAMVLAGLSDVRILGIWGMGGIGKTTIAGAIFKQIAYQFEGCCFLANIGKESEKCGGLTRLGEELLSKVLEEREVKLNTPDIKSSCFKDMLKQKKVLIVLDDVNNTEQLEFLAGEQCWFGPGSRIIITSRDRQVLKKSADYIYNVKELNCIEALNLFSWNAFKQNNPLEDFLAQSNLVVRYARGNPLALKVLGSMLFGKSKIQWESALGKLEKTPHKDIQNVLKLTYDNLDEEEQEIFLHIACLFEGEDRDCVADALDGCGFSTDIAVSTLVDKSLITISNNKLQMHDLLQEMGREIVQRESKRPNERSRLWNHADIHKVFEENTGTEAIEGILLEMSKTRQLGLNPNAFARMSNLKFLIFRMCDDHGGVEGNCNVQLPGGLESLPGELRYLYWHGYPLASLPANFCSMNLVELNLPSSKVERLWEGAKVPLSISQQLSNLTFMSLRNCKSVRSLPTNVDLQSLKTLELSGCSNLNKFPEVSMNIRYLRLRETAIQEVPLSIECLSKLVVLDMKNCTKLKCLPRTICKLKALETCILSGCKNLENFPEVLETMDHLGHLFLDETSLVNLPETFCNLKALHMLDLSDCSNLEKLPKNIKNLNFFAELTARGCNLLKLPTDIMRLSSIAEEKLSENIFDRIGQLRWLNVSRCKQLQSLPELLVGIKYLNARGCRSLESISCLKQLFEMGCSSSLESISCLRQLFEMGCSSSLESISCLKQLFELGYSSSLGDESFVFTNCHKLDQDKCADIVTHVQLKIQHFAMGWKHYDRKVSPAPSICFTYPGIEIPEWFTYKNIGSSITIQHLPLHWLNHRFLGFSLCIVVGFDDDFICDFPRGLIECKCNFGNNYDGCIDHIFTLGSWKYFPARSYESKHVFLWYDCRWYDTTVAKSSWLNEGRCNEVSFEFSAEILDYGKNGLNVEIVNCAKVEKCGFLLLYDKDEDANQLEN